MLFKKIKSRASRSTKYTMDSCENQTSGDTEYLDMEPSSLGKVDAGSLDSNAVPDLQSNFTNATGSNEFVLFPDNLLEHSFEQYSGKTSLGLCLYEDRLPTSERVLDIPVIATQDPNRVCIDECLEPIQAVVSDYSRQLTDAFFPSDDESEEIEPDLEQVVSRRHKLKRALQFKFKGGNRNTALLLS